jgi:hypothetical protein
MDLLGNLDELDELISINITTKCRVADDILSFNE